MGRSLLCVFARDFSVFVTFVIFAYCELRLLGVPVTIEARLTFNVNNEQASNRSKFQDCSYRFDSPLILTRDVQNRIGVLRAVFQDLNGLLGWYNNEFDLTLPGFSLDLLHNRQSATASPNDQPVTFPGNLLLNGQRSVTKVVTKFFGWLLIPLANLSSVDDHVVLVRRTVDAD